MQQADEHGGEPGHEPCDLRLGEERGHQKGQVDDRQAVEEHQQEEHEQTLVAEEGRSEGNDDHNDGDNKNNQHVD